MPHLLDGLAVIPVLVGPLQALAAIAAPLAGVVFGIFIKRFIAARNLRLLAQLSGRMRALFSLGAVSLLFIAALAVRDGYYWLFDPSWQGGPPGIYYLLSPTAGGGTATATTASLWLGEEPLYGQAEEQAIAATPGASAAEPEQWPIFRGGDRRLGRSGEASLPDTAPTLSWLFADEAKNAAVTFWSSPAPVGDALFVGGGVIKGFGTNGYLYRIHPFERDEITGGPRIAWRHQVQKFVFSSPSIVDGIVVCGEGTHVDKGMKLYALDASGADGEGKRLWEYQVAGTLEASPCIADGRIYVGSGDDFLCLDLHSGELLWQATVVDVQSSPVVADGVVYVGSGRSEMARPENRQLQGQQMLAFDARDGAERWRTALPYACNAPITLAEGRLIAGTGRGTFVEPARDPAGAVVCVDAQSGAILWTAATGDNVLAAVAVEGKRVHAVSRDHSYYLIALDSGEILWRHGCEAPLLSSPAVAAGRVLIANNAGTLFCLDSSAQSELWRIDLGKLIGVDGLQDVFSSPTLAGNRIYLGLGKWGLACLSAR